MESAKIQESISALSQGSYSDANYVKSNSSPNKAKLAELLHAFIAVMTKVVLTPCALLKKQQQVARIFAMNGRELSDGSTAIFLYGSRFNHSCCPNCIVVDRWRYDI